MELCNDYISFFKAVTAKEDFIFVYDPHHASYKFWPHKIERFSDEDGCDWPISPFPDGDYIIFFASNFKNSIFGFPWDEPTACVIGHKYIDGMRQKRPRAYARKIRRAGKFI